MQGTSCLPIPQNFSGAKLLPRANLILCPDCFSFVKVMIIEKSKLIYSIHIYTTAHAGYHGVSAEATANWAPSGKRNAEDKLTRYYALTD